MLDPQEVELQKVVSHSVWVLGTKLRASARAIFNFNYQVGSPSPPVTMLLVW